MKKEIKINNTLRLKIFKDGSISLVSYDRCPKTAIWRESKSKLTLSDGGELVNELCKALTNWDRINSTKRNEGHKENKCFVKPETGEII